MTKTILLIALIIASLVGAILFWPRNSCQASGDCQVGSLVSVQLTKAQQIQAEVRDEKAVLLDVREAYEYQTGHAPGSRLAPLSTVEAGDLKLADKAMKVYLYCRSGHRANIAADTLRSQSYTNIEVIGGIAEWQALGGELVK